VGGAGEHVIPGEDSLPLPPGGVKCGRAATQERAVNHVIVDEGGGVEHFHSSGQSDEFALPVFAVG
jgi:hypothetical protein